MGDRKTIRVSEDAFKTGRERKEANDQTWSEYISNPGGDGDAGETVTADRIDESALADRIAEEMDVTVTCNNLDLDLSESVSAGEIREIVREETQRQIQDLVSQSR